MAQERPTTLSMLFLAGTFDFNDEIYLAALREMETINPFTLTHESDISFLDYCAYICRAALLHAALAPDSKVPAAAAAKMAARWLCALYANHNHLTKSMHFSSLNEATVRMNLCGDLADEFRDVDTARRILTELFLREHDALKLDAALATTIPQSSTAQSHLDVSVDTLKVFEYVCATLCNAFEGEDREYYAQSCLYFFVMSWICKHNTLPIEKPFLCKADGPHCAALQRRIEASEEYVSTEDEMHCLDGCCYKKEVDELLGLIIAKAITRTATEVCDLTHKEGPWRAGILDHVIDVCYMVEHYHNREQSEAMRALGLYDHLRPRQRARYCSSSEACMCL